MSDCVVIEGLSIQTVVGIFDWERRVKQTLSLDVAIACDLRRAGATDDLNQTLDYKALADRLRQHLESSRYRLIETLACDAAEIVLEDPIAQSVQVTVNKGGALRHAQNVAVRVARERGSPTGRPPHTAYVGVGSNIDPAEHVREALRLMHERFGAIRVSPTYRTAAVGFTGDDFLNLVVGIRTSLEPRALCGWLRETEAHCGRTRNETGNTARTLDLDLLLYDAVVDDGPPRLPHPQVESAPFVIAPLHDLAPDLVHPVSGETMAALRGTLPTDVPGVELYDEEVVY